MTALHVVQAGYRYPDGTVALANIDLDVPSGATVAIVGANGSGKTTLARLLVGLLRPTQGMVRLDDVDIATRTVAQIARFVGLSFQHPDGQIFSRSVRAEVEFGPRNLGRSPSQRDDAVERALAAVGLADAAETHPQDLGESRRKLLTIASVLAMETPIVVLDEPTTGLDAHGTRLVEAIIADLRSAGRSVIGISHDMRFVAESFAHIVLLEAGRIRLDASVGDAFTESVWPRLRAAGIEPPEAAIIGARLGLGATPTERQLLQAAAAIRGEA